MFFLKLSLTFSFLFTQAALAHRGAYGENYYFHEAEVIGRADVIVNKNEKYQYKIQITITDVRKGNAEVNDVINFTRRSSSKTVCSGPDLSKITESQDGMIILLKKNWKKEKQPILRAYPKNAQYEQILYDLLSSSEAIRIKTLQQLVIKENSPKTYFVDLLTEYNKMKDPANFPLVLDYVKTHLSILNKRGQSGLLKFIASTNDLRAVPLLISFMQEGIKVTVSKKNYYSQKYLAATNLKSIYPGAKGVNQAFELAQNDKDLKYVTEDYFSKDGSRSSLLHEDKIEQLIKQNKIEPAKKQLLDKLNKSGENKYEYYNSLERLLSLYSVKEIDDILPSIILQMKKDTLGIHDHERAYIMKVCTILNRIECLPVLKRLIARSSTSYISTSAAMSMKSAVYEIRSLGSEAMAESYKYLLDLMSTTNTNYSSVDLREQDLLRLIWLAKESDHFEMEEKFQKKWQDTWDAFSPLLKIINSDQPGPRLVTWLSNLDSYSPEARAWIIDYLGAIKEKSAVRVIADQIIKLAYSSGRGHQEIKNALINIDSQETLHLIERLMTHENIFYVRSQATQILLDLDKENAHELSLKIINTKDYGFKRTAFNYLGKNGSANVIKLIKPHCDFWTADRVYLRYAQEALTGLRKRYNYDINGPK